MNPDGIGGFQKGKSGNPGGRPAELAEVKMLAREQTEASIAALVAIRDNSESPAAARVSAANSLLDRGWGRPAQALEHSGPNGGPLQSEKEFRLVDGELRLVDCQSPAERMSSILEQIRAEQVQREKDIRAEALKLLADENRRAELLNGSESGSGI